MIFIKSIRSKNPIISKNFNYKAQNSEFQNEQGKIKEVAGNRI